MVEYHKRGPAAVLVGGGDHDGGAGRRLHTTTMLNAWSLRRPDLMVEPEPRSGTGSRAADLQTGKRRDGIRLMIRLMSETFDRATLFVRGVGYNICKPCQFFTRDTPFLRITRGCIFTGGDRDGSRDGAGARETRDAPRTTTRDTSHEAQNEN